MDQSIRTVRIKKIFHVIFLVTCCSLKDSLSILTKFNNHPRIRVTRGGVEDTRLEAKAKDTKKIRDQGQGQGQPFRGQTLSRPRTGMLEAKAKDQGHKRKCSQKKKKVFTKIFQAISTKTRFPKKFFKRSPKF